MSPSTPLHSSLVPGNAHGREVGLFVTRKVPVGTSGS